MRNTLRWPLGAVLLCSLLGAITSRPAVADIITSYWGCLQCHYQNVAGTIARDYCITAGHEETGSTRCYETDFGLQRYCDLGGDPCLNVNVNGGGGGAGGGGGNGGECTIAAGGFCPASCTSCVTNPYPM